MSVINNKLALLSNKFSKQKLLFYFYCQKQFFEQFLCCFDILWLCRTPSHGVIYQPTGNCYIQKNLECGNVAQVIQEKKPCLSVFLQKICTIHSLISLICVSKIGIIFCCGEWNNDVLQAYLPEDIPTFTYFLFLSLRKLFGFAFNVRDLERKITHVFIIEILGDSLNKRLITQIVYKVTF